MTDDRTEEALRRALQDAARRVNVPMGSLPDPAPEPAVVRRRAELRVPAIMMLVLVIVAGSIALIASRDDGPSVSTFGAGSEPITSENADIEVFMNVSATADDNSAVLNVVERSSAVEAYTFLGKDSAYLEFRAIFACKPDLLDSIHVEDLPASFRLRLTDASLARSLALDLASQPGVDQVQLNPHLVSGGPGDGDGTSTTSAPSTSTPSPSVVTVPQVTPTTVAPETGDASTPTTTTGEPQTTLPAATTTVAAGATTPVAPVSKSIPPVVPAPADCAATTTNGHVVQATPNQATTATLPPAGEQPAEVEAARAAVKAMWIANHDGSVPLEQRIPFMEDPEVLGPLTRQAAIGKEQTIAGLRAEVFRVVFTSPTRAAVEWQNTFAGGGKDIRQVGYAVLIDGRWLLSRETQCGAIARANFHCPEGP